MSDKSSPKIDEKDPKTTAKPSESPAKKEVVKVKFHRTHPAFAISIGEETEISQEDFDKYDQEESFFKRIHTR